METDRITKISFRFVPMGQVAPDSIPEGEVWVDVGNRVGPKVLDHHGGDTSAWSASELVMEMGSELIMPHIRENKPLRIVLHSQPDLDAICGAWLITKMVTDKLDPNSSRELQSIVQIVSENDQGLVKTNDAVSCWPIVMRSIIGSIGREEVDPRSIYSWFGLFDKTLEVLKAGGSFSDSAERIITPELRTALAREQMDYDYDVQHGIQFQIMLPLQREYSLKDRDIASLNGIGGRRVLCDALYLRNPISLLFKELARGDVSHSAQRRGFSMLVVNWDVRLNDGRVYQRYMISADPLVGVSLAGLGSLLEKAEQAKEDKAGGPHLPGRERVKIGEGRFGMNVVSPWYDGRGHKFTIVDSPSLTLGGGICASQLDSQEIQEIIWRYGDPSRFIRVQGAELMRISLAPLDQLTDQPGRLTLRDILIRWPEGYTHWTGDMMEVASDVSIRELCSKPRDDKRPYSETEQIWAFYNDLGFSLRSARLVLGAYSLGDITDTLKRIRSEDWFEPPSNGPSTSSPILCQYIVHLGLCSEEPSITQDSPAYKLALYRLSAGIETGFPKEGEYELASSFQTVRSEDGRCLFALFTNGYVLTEHAGSSDGTKSFEGVTSGGVDLLPVMAFVLSVKSKLIRLSEAYFEHIRCRKTSMMERLLLEDREKLFWLEQRTQIQIVSEDPFVQKAYERIKAHMDICERFMQATRQIGNLAVAVKEARSSSLTKLSFILSAAVPPLLLTFSFFGGRFLDKDFKDKYRLFIPEGPLNWLSQHLGLGHNWLSFLIVLAILYSSLLFLWLLIGRRRRKTIERARKYVTPK